jgi:GNAT superfamily N-acetyltransferase
MFGDRQVAEALLGYVGEEPAAFALFFHSFSTFLGKPGIYLEDLYVRPEHRGSGVGTSLLRRLARLAKDRGCGRLEWWVLDWNEPAINFYKSLGAVPMDDWTVYRLAGEKLDELAAGD